MSRVSGDNFTAMSNSKVTSGKNSPNGLKKAITGVSNGNFTSPKGDFVKDAKRRRDQ